MQKNFNEIKIAIILGTRAELIKFFPLMLELEKNKISYYFIHTGQHNLKDLCNRLGVKEPDIVLTEEPKKSSKFNTKQIKAVFWNLRLIFKIKKELKKFPNLKYVIYHGDTMTTATASIASSKFFNFFKKYKNVHLEAGLRSFNLFEPFPEEISRRIADKFSNILLVPSKFSKENVKKYKKKEVVIIGNTIIDSVKISLDLAKKEKIKSLSNKRFVLITLHRHENLKNKERLTKIVKIIKEINIPCFFSVYDNTLKKLKDFNLLNKLKENKNIHLIKPLDYISFIYQMSKCSLIICDGGSMQEESLILKKPCIILRNNTERQEGLQTNFQYLSKLSIEKTKQKIKEYLNPSFKIKPFKNPYGKEGVSKKILKILR
ncbi:UDP-N-acetylglucosamine 2-epimerase (non-hydrolyzing) [Candidatus Woesearchaeota archaeon]|nr:UDP-N-acetylglucosamine 2-epimerase (non-hydrolyzing) [Candidatus Woesearchaeota archaeon]